MQRYRLTGQPRSPWIEPDPAGPLVFLAEIAPLLEPGLLEVLVDYADRLAVWDARTGEGVHSFESMGLDDKLRAWMRAHRAPAGPR